MIINQTLFGQEIQNSKTAKITTMIFCSTENMLFTKAKALQLVGNDGIFIRTHIHT
jgi:hypothetical protein